MRNKICCVILLNLLLSINLFSQQPIAQPVTNQTFGSEMPLAMPDATLTPSPQPQAAILQTPTAPAQPQSTEFMGMPAASVLNEAAPFGINLQDAKSIMPALNQSQVPVTGAADLNIPVQTQQPNIGEPGLPGGPIPGAIDAAQSKPDDKTPKTDDKDDADKKDIYLNFENADLLNFVNYIAEIRKMNLIVAKEIEATKISLTIRSPLTKEGAWNVFLTVLEMAGFSIIKSGDVHKVIPKDKKITEQPLPSYINIAPDALPDNDLTIRYVMFLTNIPISEVQQLLESMLSQPYSVIPQKEVNGFVITDKSLNIKSAVKLLRDLDASGLPEEVTFLHLKRANARDVQELLTTLTKDQSEGNALARLLGKTSEGSLKYFSSGTRIIPEDRTNSLILLGNPKSNKKIIDFVVNNIDTELKEVESPLHIFELQNTEATQIAEILKSVTTPSDSVAGQTASKYGSIRGGVKYFRPMTIWPDKDGNRLIVSSIDKQDWKLLKETIRDLDKPQPQVAIETLIVTVSADDQKELGGALRNKHHNQIGKNIDLQSAPLWDTPTLEYTPDKTTPISLLGKMLEQLVFKQGTSVMTLGNKDNIWGAFYALRTQNNASILAQPFVTVANKSEAEITVGSTKRVIQDKDTTTKSEGRTSISANTVLKLTPQINLDGIIKMDINLNIEDFLDAEGTNKSIRHLETKVTVADGQVLVLGGFVKTQVSEEKSKTPLLGDIPILGWMFKKQSRSLIKTYIFIFLRPTIIKPRQMPGIELYTKLKLHNATDTIEDNIETKRAHDPIQNWFFNPENENYSHKVIDFANARYQPTSVNIKQDVYYRALSDTSTQEAFTEKADAAITSEKVVSTIQKSVSAPETSIQPIPLNVIPEEAKSRSIEKMTSEKPLQQEDKQTKLKNLITSIPAVQNDTTQNIQPFLPLLPESPVTKTKTGPTQQKSTTRKQPEVDKRAQLRKLLNEIPSGEPFLEPQVGNPNKIPLVPEQAPVQNKRKQMQDFISKEPSGISEEERLIVDPSKRNKLKEFLQESSTFAKNAHQKKSGKQRVIA